MGDEGSNGAVTPEVGGAEVDVFILGAGPTGLTLACDLARKGVSFMIADLHSTTVQQSRALMIQARSLEIFQDLGVAHDLLEAGHRARGLRLRIDGRHVSDMTFSGLDSSTPYPFSLVLEQSETERILVNRLRELGHEVHRPVAAWKIDGLHPAKASQQAMQMESNLLSDIAIQTQNLALLAGERTLQSVQAQLTKGAEAADAFHTGISKRLTRAFSAAGVPPTSWLAKQIGKARLPGSESNANSLSDSACENARGETGSPIKEEYPSRDNAGIDGNPDNKDQDDHLGRGFLEAVAECSPSAEAEEDGEGPDHPNVNDERKGCASSDANSVLSSLQSIESGCRESQRDDQLAAVGEMEDLSYPLTVHIHRLDEMDLPPEMQSRVAVRCKYLVGCDGARSFVRKEAGIAYQGETLPMEFLVSDIEVDWGLPLLHDMLQGILNDSGVMMCLPMTYKRWRIICSRPSEAMDGESHVPLPAPDYSTLQEIVTKMVPGSVLKEVFWTAAYRLHSRVASTMLKGRVVLAGDAAHIHPPTYGQGMNTGIQDAHNLGWKLASILQCGADPSLLESYNTERQQIASPFFRCAASILMPVLFNIEYVTDCITRMVSMLNHKYIADGRMFGQATNSGLSSWAVEPGMRAPDALVKSLPLVGGDGDREAAKYVFDYFYGGHHTLLLLLNCLPPNAKSWNFWGCEIQAHTGRWSMHAADRLQRLGRVIGEIMGPPLRVVHGPGHPLFRSKLTDEEGHGLDESADDRIAGLPSQEIHYTGGVSVVWAICGLTVQTGSIAPPEGRLVDSIPPPLVAYLLNSRATCGASVIVDFALEIKERYGVNLGDPNLGNAEDRSGAFVLVRPDGVVSHTGYSGDSVASGQVIDYALSNFKRA